MTAPLSEQQLAEIADGAWLPDRDALRQMLANALGQHPDGRDVSAVLDLVDSVLSGATQQSDADHREAYRLLAGGFHDRGAEVGRLTARVAELETENAALLAEGGRMLADRVEALRAKDKRIAALESITANAEKLYHEWLTTAAEHHSISTIKEVRETPLLAGMQEGRANQYADCANELRDVLDGEDPDSWEHGVSVEVAATEAGDPR